MISERPTGVRSAVGNLRFSIAIRGGVGQECPSYHKLRLAKFSPESLYRLPRAGSATPTAKLFGRLFRVAPLNVFLAQLCSADVKTVVKRFAKCR